MRRVPSSPPLPIICSTSLILSEVTTHTISTQSLFKPISILQTPVQCGPTPVFHPPTWLRKSTPPNPSKTPPPSHRAQLTYANSLNSNITWHPSLSRHERNGLRKQRGLTLWLTGLSASGKSTIATALEQHLLHLGLAAYRLDGDNVRFGLNKDLGFSEKDRNENIRRIAEVSIQIRSLQAGRLGDVRWLTCSSFPPCSQVAKLFADSSTITITSFISPYLVDRKIARELHAAAGQGGDDGIPFIEVYVDIPVEVAEQRDPKGLYKKARAGEIPNFTGISAPYEAPENPEIHIRSDKLSVEESVTEIVEYLKSKDLLPATV